MIQFEHGTGWEADGRKGLGNHRRRAVVFYFWWGLPTPTKIQNPDLENQAQPVLRVFSVLFKF
ncbi:hypothetical protein ABID16_004664 [Rhizobium aquaticum]|uniref:Porin n=1 Tax=Rhizobium aquaticum TaxID=1549636 RepID=A0ABV2J6C5_9HYPH